MFKFKTVYLLAATLLFAGVSSHASDARADASDFLKGCLILGGVGIGGTAIAISQSSATLANQQGLMVAGLTSCLIGGFLAGDIAKKAELTAGGDLTMENQKKKNQVYSVMHDLCVLKHKCPPSGIPYEIEPGSQAGSAELPPMQPAGKDGVNAYVPSAGGSTGYAPLKSGNNN